APARRVPRLLFPRSRPAGVVRGTSEDAGAYASGGAACRGIAAFVTASRSSVALAADAGPRATDEKVEIDTAVGLLHRCAVEPDPAARRMGSRWGPARAAPVQLGAGDVEVQSPPRNVELDRIAIFHQRERAARRRLGCDVEYDCTVRGPRHPRIGDAHHVGDTALQQLGRQRKVADLG